MHPLLLAGILSTSGSVTTGVARFTIRDPIASPLGRRHGQYFSDATADIYLTVDGKKLKLPISVNSPLCVPTWTSISCAVELTVPAGPLTFTAETVDANGHGLSEVSGTAVIKGTTNVPLALSGIWESATLRLANPNPLMGGRSSIPVTVSGYDADGALIIGPEPYARPIPLYDTDTTGATAFSTKYALAPGAQITLAYDGTSYVNPKVSAGKPPAAINSGATTLIPSVRATEYSLPGANSPNVEAVGPMAVNADGSLSFIGYYGSLWRSTLAGKINGIPVPKPLYSIATGADHELWAIAQCLLKCSAGDYDALESIAAGGAVSQVVASPLFGDGPLTVSRDGNFWLAGSDAHGLQEAVRVTRSGAVTPFAVPKVEQLAGGVLGSDGNLWFISAEASQTEAFVRVTPAGKATLFPIPAADTIYAQIIGNMALGPDGQVYELESSALLERVSAKGVVSHLPIADAGDANIGGEESSNALAFGPDGALWISTGGTAYCRPVLERVTTGGSSVYLQIPILCNDVDGPAPEVTSFVVGPDRALWYTRGLYVGRIALP